MSEPPEVVALPPMPPLEHRLQIAGGFHVVRMLLPYLDSNGLLELRAWLRHDDTRAMCVGCALVDSRAALLEQTCHRLVSLGASPLEYFEGVGDVMPSVPDDAGDLA